MIIEGSSVASNDVVLGNAKKLVVEETCVLEIEVVADVEEVVSHELEIYCISGVAEVREKIPMTEGC